MKTKYPLVYLEWEDAHASADWFTDEEAKNYFDEQYGKSKSVGWLIRENEDWIMLASRLGESIGDTSESFGMLQKIPKTWIVKKVRINLKKS
jgi:hypothetical protein